MQVHFGLEHLVAEWPEAVGCIGTFDGVHLGHQTVITQTVRRAREIGVPAVLITFDRHPAAVLHPTRAPLAIGSVESNLARFAELGVDIALILPFTKELAHTSADTFFQLVILGGVRLKEIVVGHDFAFGHNRVGTPEWLSERMPTEKIPAYLNEGARVSSSAIRQAVQEGRVEDAAKWLGRPFTIPGVIVRGQQLGRKIGYPTANLARSFHQVLPADGIYGGMMTGAFGAFRAAVSIGKRPTVQGTDRTIEAFLIDYKGDEFYGESVELALTQWIREERHFDSLDAMCEQIAKDVMIAQG
ncbi:MAG: riboflavin biosynthesis protein RibF [Fimbriimonadaceae bacterium]